MKNALCLGTFDGVHIGHTQIINDATKEAKKSGLCSVVWSFQTPPKKFFSEDDKNISITTFQEKRKIIKNVGDDILISTKFDKKQVLLRNSAEKRTKLKLCVINHIAPP